MRNSYGSDCVFVPGSLCATCMCATASLLLLSLFISLRFHKEGKDNLEVDHAALTVLRLTVFVDS